MIRKSFVTGSGSSTRVSTSGTAISSLSSVSGQPSTAAIASASGSNGASVWVVMSWASLPPDDEPVDRAIGRLVDQLVAGGATPRRHVLDRPGIRREELDDGAGRQRFDGLGGLDDRHRARKPSGVDRLGDLD